MSCCIELGFEPLDWAQVPALGTSQSRGARAVKAKAHERRKSKPRRQGARAKATTSGARPPQTLESGSCRCLLCWEAADALPNPRWSMGDLSRRRRTPAGAGAGWSPCRTVKRYGHETSRKLALDFSCAGAGWRPCRRRRRQSKPEGGGGGLEKGKGCGRRGKRTREGAGEGHGGRKGDTTF